MYNYLSIGQCDMKSLQGFVILKIREMAKEIEISNQFIQCKKKKSFNVINYDKSFKKFDQICMFKRLWKLLR